MHRKRFTGRRQRLALAAVMAAVAMALAVIPPGASAQSKPEEAQPSQATPAAAEEQQNVLTIFLKNASSQNDLNDIQTDLRNVLPRARIYGIQTQNAITVKGTAEELTTAQKLIADLDRPKKIYRLTYTLTDFDGSKRVGLQQFTLLAGLGEKTTFKQGSRVPIVTGTFEGQPAGTQVQYQDIGLNINAQVNGSPDALSLHTKIEQSSLGEDKSVGSAQDPVVRQTTFDESSVLPEGKPVVLGALDLPGTTRRQEIAVVADLVR